MRTLIITIAVLLLNISGLLSIEIKNKYEDRYQTITPIEIRIGRFSKIPLYGYKEDSDSQVIGSGIIKSRENNVKQIQIQQKIKKEKQQSTKFKSTYLDFTILQEDNIS
jgi:hypothetical protein